MEKKHTLILIDGHALAFREYYALERTNMQTSNGVMTWAVYGFFKAIFDLLHNSSLDPDSVAVAFDVSHHTFRTEKYENYKSNRAEMPDNLKSQMDLIYEGLHAFNIPVYTKMGFEADDVIGTISKQACKNGYEVLILTGDQDAFQLVDKDGCVKVILPTFNGQKEYGWLEVHEKLGVYPDQVIDYKALRGDTSDCIPGIKGIGEKTACELLGKYYTLEDIYEHIDDVSKNSVREKLINGKEDAFMSRYLATIVRDLDINFDFENAKVVLPELENVTDFLKRMQFHSFIKNINQILCSFDKNHCTEDKNYLNNKESSSVTGGQLGLFTQLVQTQINQDSFECSKELVVDSEDFENLVNDLNAQSVISFEIEADITNAVSFEIIGISFAFDKNMSYDGGLRFKDSGFDTKSFYVPIGHNGLETQLKKDYVISKLKPIFENADIKKVTYNLKNQINILRKNNVMLCGCVFDCMLASYVKNPARKHDLEIQSMENLNHAIPPYAQYRQHNGPKKQQGSLQDAVITNVLNWAADKCAVIIRLTKYWINNLVQGESEFLNKIELPLSGVLAKMEYDGVSVDEDYLAKLSEELQNIILKKQEKIFKIAGERFNLNSPKQTAEILFEKLNLETKKKQGKNNFSTNAEVLEKLAQEYDIAKYILEYRKYSKLKSTYTDALPELIDSYDKRIHTTYNQAITATGRLSSSNPNLQNIPARTDDGRKIRKAFVPKDRENSVIISADYSQIELRLLAHISGDRNLINAFKSGIDIHTLTASKVYGISPEEVTKEMRYKAKAVNFGIIYGQSKYGLASALGISKQEAEDFINKYFQTYPKVREYMENTVKDAEINGYVQTLYGRRRYLATEFSSSSAMIRDFAKRAAINQPIQGSSADLIKIAMVDFQSRLDRYNLKSKLIMQVHDELVVECPIPETEQIERHLKESMELGQPFEVPLVIDISKGNSWRED